MKYSLEVVNSNSLDFEKHWNNFIEENINVGPFYSALFIRQLLARKDGYSKENKSFIVLWEGKPVAIVPLTFERLSEYCFFSVSLGFNTFYAPLISCSVSDNVRQRIRTFIFQEIDRLAAELNIVKAMFSIDPFTYYTENEYFNYLTLYGYVDVSISTQIIDLTQDVKLLKAGRRKHCKALANKGLKTYTFFIMNKDNADYEIHELYRKMHAKAAGRATRSKETFDLQYERLIHGNATLIGAKYSEAMVQMNYFDHCNGYVYYSSAADDPSFDDSDVPISHALLWYSIEYFKKIGFKYYELGAQYFSDQLFCCTSEKEKNISFFKRGFGGITIPLFRGIKYFDQEFMKKDLEINLRNLMANYQA